MSYLGKTPPLGSMLKKGGPRAKQQNSDWREDRDGMSDQHLALVRKLPCCVCRRAPAGEVHHLKTTGERGLSVRTCDKWGVPLCRADHDAVENVGARNELRWFKERGIEDVVWLASALWRATGNLPAMVKIVLTHRDAP